MTVNVAGPDKSNSHRPSDGRAGALVGKVVVVIGGRAAETGALCGQLVAGGAHVALLCMPLREREQIQSACQTGPGTIVLVPDVWSGSGMNFWTAVRAVRRRFGRVDHVFDLRPQLITQRNVPLPDALRLAAAFIDRRGNQPTC